ncbi:MAG: SufS family cysteine desulfurase [Pseudobacteriovorax sp.]|nr:SufS family cysteine desulfurase [Pseudobacteriovorax sp.]
MANRNLSEIRRDFPLLTGNASLAFLDSAASSQKPQPVIDAISHYYETYNSNVHRGLYSLSEKATKAFEDARETCAEFIGAKHSHEVIFTKGTTDGINLLAQTFAGTVVNRGDEIVLTVAEHHSNIVPWQILAEKVGALIKYIPLKSDYHLDIDVAKEVISDRTKVVAFAHVSNVLGVIHPVDILVDLAQKVGAVTVIDGAQGAPHLDINVSELECDFYTVSGHKMLGPTGIGFLYGKEDWLNKLPPYQGGGDMIEEVKLEGSTWAPLPSKFEAGTPNIAGAIGLASAVSYLSDIDRSSMLSHDRTLGLQAIEGLRSLGDVKVFVDTSSKGLKNWTGVVTFAHEQIHPHDLATICAEEGVCMRAGHHCAQPLMSVLEVPATARISPYLYNNSDDIERFLVAMERAKKLFIS